MLAKQWRTYDGSYKIKMKHKFKLFLKPKCEYSKARFFYRTTETAELDYLQKLYRNVFGCCFDLGANIGYWSKFLVCCLKVKELHSFEPFPPTFRILKKNLKNHEQVRCKNLALSNRSGNLKLFIESNHSGDNRPCFTFGRRILNVPCTSIDDYAKKIKVKKIDFIKIDIQGGEVKALEGAKEAIKTQRPLVMIEVAPEIDSKINTYLFHFLRRFNYRAFSVRTGFKQSIKAEYVKTFKGNLFLEPK